MAEETVKFLAYEPTLKPLSGAQGGGFVVTFQVPESEWDKIKNINDPVNKLVEFTVELKGEKISAA